MGLYNLNATSVCHTKDISFLAYFSITFRKTTLRFTISLQSRHRKLIFPISIIASGLCLYKSEKSDCKVGKIVKSDVGNINSDATGFSIRQKKTGFSEKASISRLRY